FMVVLVLSWILIIAVVLPFVKNDFWIFRILEYPRLQKLITCLAVLIGLLVTRAYTSQFGFITSVLLALCVGYLLNKIFPYTLAAKKEMKTIAGSDNENQLKLYAANVYQESRTYNKVLEQINETDPDLILLVETDTIWQSKMDVLLVQYPHTLRAPLSNTYGMLFYSRLPITSGAIKYLVEKDVPSLEATIELPSGQPVKIWGLHPKPPVPCEDTKSTAKDKELMKVAFAAKKEKLPVIVMGDLNDVAWSYVTKLFRKTSGLLDPRRGRGFYSTFSANNWFMRFPLDYVFCSSNFGLLQMKRLDHNGSDHFPMFIHFEYAPTLERVQEEPKADTKERADAVEKVL
ncbi:MAG TPA: endonuclease/exonuclease/phosphatase family protein, partial [Flavisolibacter sp.]|nr:endonuclease/exonuclease/phosphatase family protein [Flavisolibacter sp.]